MNTVCSHILSMIDVWKQINDRCSISYFAKNEH